MVALFTSLPNELVCEILKVVRPEDLENFAQLSRHVFWLAIPFLNEHRALIRRYHTLRNNKDPGSIAALLSTVIANPRIASYVKKVELGRLREANAGLDQANVYTKEALKILTTAALESECLKTPWEEEVSDEREYWSSQIQDGNEDILLAILLPLLPNLGAILVEATSARLNWYDSAIEQAASATKPTLCKLAHIWLNPRGGDGYHLDEIQRFCALPSVRVLTAPKAFGMDYLEELIPDTKSDVTHLKLWEACVDSKALYDFLQGFPKLQSFSYSYLGDSDEVPHDAFLIRSGLLAHCKATLQSLTLLEPGCRHTSFMGSLRGFEALEEVYTEWSFLISENPNGCGPRLNEHLPASLVCLKIHDSEGRGKSQYEEVIKSAQYAKEYRLQKLKSLFFAGTQDRLSLETVDQGLRKKCLSMGIILEFFPHAPASGGLDSHWWETAEKAVRPLLQPSPRTLRHVGN